MHGKAEQMRTMAVTGAMAMATKETAPLAMVMMVVRSRMGSSQAIGLMVMARTAAATVSAWTIGCHRP